MATTMGNGVVIPDPPDLIASNGVQAMRNMGGSINAQLGYTSSHIDGVDADSKSRDDGLADQIAGMEGMDYVGAWDSAVDYRINDVVTHGGDSWARLTAGSAGEPGAAPDHWGLVARKGDAGGFGELAETDVDGLYEPVDSGIDAKVDALMYRSGRRDITSLLDPAPISGALYIERRGGTVWLHVDGVSYDQDVPSITFYNVIANGFRAPHPVDLSSAPRTADEMQGNFRTYNHVFVIYRLSAGANARGYVSWPTDQAIPTTLPGTPA